MTSDEDYGILCNKYFRKSIFGMLNIIHETVENKLKVFIYELPWMKKTIAHLDMI
jgi:hypothetical protein